MNARVCRADPDELQQVGVVLGRAFGDDPVWNWVYPQPDRWRRLARFFRALAGSMQSVDEGAVLVGDRGRGAALWRRSDAAAAPSRSSLRVPVALMTSGASMRRLRVLTAELDQRRPDEPHAYLAFLGVDPDHQGTGVGTTLLREVLAVADSEARPTYLETETEANVAFYHRHGFTVIDEFDTPSGGPHLWLMWRDPT